MHQILHLGDESSWRLVACSILRTHFTGMVRRGRKIRKGNEKGKGEKGGNAGREGGKKGAKGRSSPVICKCWRQ